jgi:hypothetical protein
MDSKVARINPSIFGQEPVWGMDEQCNIGEVTTYNSACDHLTCVNVNTDGNPVLEQPNLGSLTDCAKSVTASRAEVCCHQ